MKSKNFSRKREAILETIQHADHHPSADWIFKQLQQQDEFKNLGLDTVYRNLRLFKEEGVIVSLGVIDGQERFDRNVHNHGHFICQGCKLIFDIPLHEKETHALTEHLHTTHNVVITKVDMTVHGYCADCIPATED